MGRGFLTN
uniref:Uncharacterized protein n=1 Tax=Arundo donax TaxID=35708 RepID=A0A0A9HS49_ARUDO